jgi:hypothetical protein
MTSRVNTKRKNCQSWAQYEEKGSSETAKLCHGGFYDGEHRKPCPARFQCLFDTRRKKEEEEARSRRRSLPVMNQPKPMGSSTPRRGTQEIAATPNVYRVGGPRAAEDRQYQVTVPTKTSMTYNVRGPKMWPPPDGHPMVPIPIQPPATYPESMRTAYAAARPMAQAMTPTYAPAPGQSHARRLLGNMGNGMGAALGLEVYEYFRNFDVFGGRE